VTLVLTRCLHPVLEVGTWFPGKLSESREAAEVKRLADLLPSALSPDTSTVTSDMPFEDDVSSDQSQSTDCEISDDVVITVPPLYRQPATQDMRHSLREDALQEPGTPTVTQMEDMFSDSFGDYQGFRADEDVKSTLDWMAKNRISRVPSSRIQEVIDGLPSNNTPTATQGVQQLGGPQVTSSFIPRYTTRYRKTGRKFPARARAVQRLLSG